MLLLQAPTTSIYDETLKCYYPELSMFLSQQFIGRLTVVSGTGTITLKNFVSFWIYSKILSLYYNKKYKSLYIIK